MHVAAVTLFIWKTIFLLSIWVPKMIKTHQTDQSRDIQQVGVCGQWCEDSFYPAQKGSKLLSETYTQIREKVL